MKVAIVTGVSKGIGAALAQLLLCQGFPVLGVSRTRPLMALPVDDQFTFFPVDLSRLEEDFIRPGWSVWLSKARSGEVLFFANAAQIEPVGTAEKLKMDEWRKSIEVNLTANLICLKVLLAEQRRLGFALHVVNVTSGAANRPIAGWSAYCVTKCATRMLFDVACEEAKACGAKDFCVTHVDPGVVDTDMQERLRLQSAEAFPDVLSFRNLHSENKLSTPEAAARRIWGEIGL